MLSDAWIAAQETTKEAQAKRHTIVWLPFVISFVAQVLMAYLLAGVIIHMARSGVAITARSGLISHRIGDSHLKLLKRANRWLCPIPVSRLNAEVSTT